MTRKKNNSFFDRNFKLNGSKGWILSLAGMILLQTAGMGFSVGRIVEGIDNIEAVAISTKKDLKELIARNQDDIDENSNDIRTLYLVKEDKKHVRNQK